MTILRVAAVQLDVALGEPRRNRKRAGELVAEAAGLGCTVVVLPELWSTGYALDRLESLLPDPDTLEAMVSWAKGHGIYLFGGVAEREAGRIYNSLYAFGPRGGLRGKYRKIHLFSLMGEDRCFSPGETPGLLSLPFALTGLAICYDLRFSSLFQSLALSGAELLVTAAEWPSARLDHWRILTQARAVECQAFLVACNRVGRDDQNVFGGHSLVVSPWGVVLAEGGEGEGLVTAELNLDEIAEVRARIPALKDRKGQVSGV